ncbi:alpha/beta hydrolase [Rugosibacter aromaticivorans]|uniref:Alpha/beta hydrolase n=1 Tax=Rugosibacter aromaticivorans TaxID=1565605 RepID=A0A0C5JAD3_9PROT|nr:alpha/beta hydrolase [Rugosibacter aromaticivorans]AJP48895.1 alpha/beta hydrolase [Rugosibacter aromaticivorans]
MHLNEADYQKKYINVNGVNTCYIESGAGEPLILIHGGGAGANSYGNWFACMPLFAKHFRVIAIDMLGFGSTDAPDPTTCDYSQKARYDHVAGFIRALGLAKASLVGNSMGGATAMGVAIEHPALVDKLILMGSAGLNGEITPALLPVVNYDFTREGMVKLIKTLANDKFVITQEMIDYRWNNSVKPETRAAYGNTMAWIKKQGGLFYPEEYIARVKHKTLVVNGKNDLVVPLTHAYRFLELIEHSWGYIVPHCGHWAMIEHPEDFSAAVTSFIKSH